METDTKSRLLIQNHSHPNITTGNSSK